MRTASEKGNSIYHITALRDVSNVTKSCPPAQETRRRGESRQGRVGGRVVAALICSAVLALANVGAEQKSSGSILYGRPFLELLLTQWGQRDMESGTAVSDYLFDFLSFSPEALLAFLEEHPKFFNEWLAELPERTFFDDRTCLDTSCRRRRIIEGLRDLCTFRPDLAARHVETVRRLRERLLELDTREANTSTR